MCEEEAGWDLSPPQLSSEYQNTSIFMVFWGRVLLARLVYINILYSIFLFVDALFWVPRKLYKQKYIQYANISITEINADDRYKRKKKVKLKICAKVFAKRCAYMQSWTFGNFSQKNPIFMELFHNRIFTVS